MNKYYGFYRAKVCNINDPEMRGRIKCIIPEILGEDVESAWCDPCNEVAYDNGGDWCLPQNKETVWVSFEDGDPNKPLYFGNWWTKSKSPLGSNYNSLKDKVRIISFADCTIMMRDGKIDINVGAGDSEIHIEKGKITLTGDLEIIGKLKCTDITCNDITAHDITAHNITASNVSAPNIP